MGSPLETRLALRKHGYQPVACNGKAAFMDGWNNLRDVTETEMAAWSGNNTGFLTGPNPTADIDIMHDEAATFVEDMLRDRFGERGAITVRFGNRPKRAIPFRTSAPFPKRTVYFEGGHKIEFLGEGQQLVAYGKHPDTKALYAWHGDYGPATIPCADLPEITLEEAEAFLEEAAAALVENFGFVVAERSSGNGKANGAGGEGIHHSQVSETARLLRSGIALDTVVAEVLEATRLVADVGWDWKKEQIAVERMCFDFITKNPDLSHTLPDEFFDTFVRMTGQGTTVKFKHLRATGWTIVGAPPKEEAPPGPEPEGQPEAPDALSAIWAADWLVRDLPEPDYLLGELLTTTSRVIIVGATGLGKTMLGLAIAVALTSNQNFLHWVCYRKARVLYVDGEMARTEMQRRIGDAIRRAGGTVPEGLAILSREDFEDLPPLNTPAGQKWMDLKITELGGFDFIIFDNIQCLTEGSMKEEDPWSAALPWVRSLTRRRIGQLWFHHTGHDASRGYGTKTKEWAIDSQILMETCEVPGTDLSFSLKFTKARMRRPENQADFEEITLSLKDDQWVATDGCTKTKPLAGAPKVAFNQLMRAIKTDGGPVPPWVGGPDVRTKPAVRVSVWRSYCDRAGLSSGQSPDSQRKAFDRAKEKLQELEIIGVWDDFVWVV